MIKRNKKIGILMHSYVLNESPTIYYLSRGFIKAGFQVDIYINEYPKGKIVYAKNGINIYSPNRKGIDTHAKKDGNLISLRYSHLLKNILRPLKQRMQLIKKKHCRFHSKIYYLNRQLCSIEIFHKLLSYNDSFSSVTKDYAAFLNEQNLNDYEILIVIEPEGLMAYYYAKFKTPFIYLSLELNNLSCEKKEIANILKKVIEIKYIKRALFSIIQDEIREEILRKDNKIPDTHQFLYLPVSSAGEPYQKKSEYFRSKFRISNDKKIVLYAGSIMPWACLLEIADSMKEWDEKFVFVIHGARFDQEYLEKVINISKMYDRIYISNEWVDYENIDNIISSADIGIVAYRMDTINNYLIKNASGKISAYLKSGLPIISGNYGGMKKFFEDTGCGECFDIYKHIGRMLIKIDNNHDNYRKMAFDAFLSYYSFDKHFNKILNYTKRSLDHINDR